ncbi:hypothetical protein [Lunatimonas salinarum]|uniref:hypothetical protein n=1 Tax=Lunatimonas salinarum TaxID=1774590 RepID=UPI001AE0B444|nr:hypothetical protein [Lunatimonas salinarum]
MQLLKFHELDIIGPEVGIFSQTDTEPSILSSLAEFPSIESNYSEVAESKSVFYNPDKFELLDHDSFTVSARTKSVENGSQRKSRICDWGKFKNLEDNQVIFVFNVQSTSSIAVDDKKLILEKIRQINKDGLPFILTGDFYSTGPQDTPTIN